MSFNRNYKIMLCKDFFGAERLFEMQVREDGFSFVRENVSEKFNYQDVDKIETRMRKGHIRFIDGREYFFYSVSLDDLWNLLPTYVVMTQRIVKELNALKRLNYVQSSIQDEKIGNINEEILEQSLIDKIFLKEPINQDYWQIYELSALKDKADKTNNSINSGMLTDPGVLFQNAICLALLDREQEVKSFTEQLITHYGRITFDSLRSTDLFRIYALTFLWDDGYTTNYLKIAIERLKSRIYRTEEDDGEELQSKSEYVERKQKHRLFDLLQVCRLAYICRDYKEVSSSAEEGMRILNELEQGLSDEDLQQNPASESRFELYEKMFHILSGLTYQTGEKFRRNRDILLSEMPEFYDSFINPVGKKESRFSIEEEVQWAIIYFRASQRILGLFEDMNPNVALRKFLG